MQKILDEGVIRARDQNKVFVEKANSRRLSPRDADDRYGLGRGKGNAYIEFNIEDERLSWQANPENKAGEWFIIGDVILAGRNAQAFFNY